MTLEQVMETVKDQLTVEQRVSLAIAISSYGAARQQKGISAAIKAMSSDYEVKALHEPSTIDIAHKDEAA